MIFKASLTAAALILAAGTAGAQESYTYPAKDNFCPQGLQPISLGGVICCGTPTTNMTYDQAMVHPVPKRKVKRHYKRVEYIPTEKGIPTYKGLSN